MSGSLRAAIPRFAALSAQALHWRPMDFWAATPGELIMALTPLGANAGAAPSRHEIEEMMKRDDHG